jgi:DNA adenine methylase
VKKESKEISKKHEIVKPFLRWAGGKTWFLKTIEQFLPYRFRNYYEPFLGGAAVFFHLKQQGKLKANGVLSDLNQDLIDCFLQIRDNVEKVIKNLKTYQNEKDFYYHIRKFTPFSAEEKAAKFIYLNRTSFNGIYRVNLEGVYNVPYGFKTYKVLFDYDNLRRTSALLQGTHIISQDFQNCLKPVEKGDLVFLDPPYTVAHKNNGFIKYNQKIFAWCDQHRLSEAIKKIVDKGAYFILTNAAHPSIDELFCTYGIKVELRRFSVIGGKKAKREIKSEHVFSNSNHILGDDIS